MAERAGKGAGLDSILAETRANQGRAADPAASAWVGANAGSGKTYVLVERVLRLLIAGVEPQRILCLTYTKAAAAEMSNRLFDRLALWASLAESTLADGLAQVLTRRPAAAELVRARTLFALAIDTPGGLKVQTIHAFCERLLQRFPIEAGVAPHFAILDEATARAMIAEAIHATLREATGWPGPLAEALGRVVGHVGSESFDVLVEAVLRQRDWIAGMLRASSDDADPFEAGERRLAEAVGVSRDVDVQAIDARIAGLLSEAEMARLATVLAGGSKKDLEAAARLAVCRGARSPAECATAIADLLLTEKGKPRAKQLTAALAAAHPDLVARLDAAAAACRSLLSTRKAIEVVEASGGLLRLAARVAELYADAKSERAALDYDDLIARTRALVADGAAAQWVLYKLDNGLDHILVDEAQDTSPLQWRIVEALAAEFYAGRATAERPRTVFAVGDEKQSIYGFQGAAPEMFASMGTHFESGALGAGARFHRVPLEVSFRSAPVVLEAVDRVFASRLRTPGVSSGPVRHVARRQGHAGLIEVWPVESSDPPDDEEPWSPLASAPAGSGLERLAARIADTIAGWLAGGDRLASEARPIAARDILVLVRRRRPFGPALIQALAQRGVPVMGADRLAVTEQIGVEDLLSLCEMLLLPEDDLALAEVLKSPLFDLGDDDLVTIGHARRGSLWQSLLTSAALDARYLEAGERIKRWRARADFLPPFEFLSGLLDRDGMRRRLIGRLGEEAGEAADELLNLAVAYDDQAPPSLQGFLDWLRRSKPEIKRDMDQVRDEVRVMTVHGAKGLEAPIVFLPDTCATGKGGRGEAVLEIGAPDERELAVRPLAWHIRGAKDVPALAAASAARRAREREEYNRLLYVAMTRARDRLYVAGYQGLRERDAGCWYDLVREGLSDWLEFVPSADGREILRRAVQQSAPAAPPARDREARARPLPLPDWALRHAPAESHRIIPLAPSRLAPVEAEDAGLTTELAAGRETPVSRPSEAAGDKRFLRGTLTHALLQHLPGLPAGERAGIGERFLSAAARELPARVRRSILEETLALLADPQIAPLLGPETRAEVPVVAQIPLEGRRGEVVRVSGQIDRLAVGDHDVLILDYKTNRPPPMDAAGIPRAYLLQLAAYRVALRQIYPDRPVRAALIWTYGPSLMQVSEALLDANERAIRSGEPWA